MNVQAVEKGKGTTKKITITNDKGRFSKDKIEEMVANAEKARQEDDVALKKVEAKNGLESSTYGLRNTLNDENVKSKMPPEDQAKIKEAVDSTITWLQNNQNAEAEEFSKKQKELEAVFHPIMQKFYQQGGQMPPGAQGFPPGAGGFPPGTGGMGGQGTGGGQQPTVDEVD